jgi:hypothetical protein
MSEDLLAITAAKCKSRHWRLLMVTVSPLFALQEGVKYPNQDDLPYALLRSHVDVLPDPPDLDRACAALEALGLLWPKLEERTSLLVSDMSAQYPLTRVHFAMQARRGKSWRTALDVTEQVRRLIRQRNIQTLGFEDS